MLRPPPLHQRLAQEGSDGSRKDHHWRPKPSQVLIVLRDEGGSDALKAPKQLRVGVLTPSEPFAPISKDGEGVGMAEAAGVLQPAAAPEHA